MGKNLVLNMERNDFKVGVYNRTLSKVDNFIDEKAANEKYNWNLNFGQIALIWREGCIIKAKFLDRIKEAFEVSSNLSNLLLYPFFKNAINNCQQNWRDVVATASIYGIPVPAFSKDISLRLLLIAVLF